MAARLPHIVRIPERTILCGCPFGDFRMFCAGCSVPAVLCRFALRRAVWGLALRRAALRRFVLCRLFCVGELWVGCFVSAVLCRPLCAGVLSLVCRLSDVPTFRSPGTPVSRCYPGPRSFPAPSPVCSDAALPALPALPMRPTEFRPRSGVTKNGACPRACAVAVNHAATTSTAWQCRWRGYPRPTSGSSWYAGCDRCRCSPRTRCPNPRSYASRLPDRPTWRWWS